MSDPAELPIFKYYPDPVAGGSVEASDAACAGCKRRRGFISPSLLYAEKVPDDARFCPWCIADGSATALFGGTFNEIAAGASDDARDEVEQRTPNFMTWQDWSWPVHCRDGCVYLGSPPRGELRMSRSGTPTRIQPPYYTLTCRPSTDPGSQAGVGTG